MKRILFVDDDRMVLDGLRVRLHPLRAKWDMVFVESGARAITEFEHRPCDVVVADMRMRAMDGAELLRIMTERWPATIRIVLSGYSDDAQVMRLVPYAHQYLSKPCELQQIEQVIERCLRLQELLAQPELRAVVGRVGKLPAMPHTYAHLQEAMSREDPSVHEVARIIGADPAIAGKVLQVVNSAFFRLPRHVARIEQAVAYLGFITIRNLVLSLEVFSQWPRRPGLVVDPQRLQQHSQQVAAAAHALTSGTPIADEAMLAGLLHDIGYWILLQQCPDQVREAIAMARAQQIELYEAERRVIGASHAEIGAYLLGIWGLPYTVIEAVAYHHEPHLVPSSRFQPLGALGIAHAVLEEHEADIFGLKPAREVAVDEEFLARLRAPFDSNEARRRALPNVENSQ